MAFKQRATERRAIALDIYITHKLEYSARWKTKNLSLHGALIDMAQDDLVPNATVEAILALKSGAVEERHHIAAHIVRVGRSGVALRFGGYGNQTYTALAHLLYVNRKDPLEVAGRSAQLQ
ncbi:MAG: PilZ domain-containing protein [Gammaproteobacteria bacterium]|nr:PilZ domain-containing protein [Gammaproteobacteria bacterium]